MTLPFNSRLPVNARSLRNAGPPDVAHRYVYNILTFLRPQVSPMGFDDLTENDMEVYEYIKDNDFESHKWNTARAASDLDLTEDEVYESLSNLTKHIKDNIYLHYQDGGIRISAE